MGIQYIMLPSDKAEKLILEYMRLFNDPKPEEEEQIHQNFLALFEELQNIFPAESLIGQDVAQIFQLIKEWDPMDYWFFELKKLPKLMQTFFETYYQNEGLIPNPDVEKTLEDLENIQEMSDETSKTGKAETENHLDEVQQARIDKRIDLLKIRMKSIQEKVIVEPPKQQITPSIDSKMKAGNITLQSPVIQIPSVTVTPPTTSLSTPPISNENHFSIPELKPEPSNNISKEIDPPQIRESPAIMSVSKVEIEKMMDSDQKFDGDHSLISHITFHKVGHNIEEMIYQNETFLQTNLENETKDKTTEDLEKIYQDLLRMRAKLTYFHKKETQITTNFQNGLITEKHFENFKNQNREEIQKLQEKIESIRSTLREELP